MTTTRRVTLECDYSTSSSTRACTQAHVTDVDKVGEAREIAADAGWTHKGAEDFCPLHGQSEGGPA